MTFWWAADTKGLTIFPKHCFVGVWQGPKYISTRSAFQSSILIGLLEHMYISWVIFKIFIFRRSVRDEANVKIWNQFVCQFCAKIFWIYYESCKGKCKYLLLFHSVRMICTQLSKTTVLPGKTNDYVMIASVL